MSSASDREGRRPLILHIISGLGTGGAEMMLYRLTTNASKVRHHIISLRELGTIGPRMQSAGLPVTALNLHHLLNLPAAVVRLRRLVAKLQPDVIQGWMTHGNIAATYAAIGTQAPLLWNVRQSIVDFKYEKPATVAAIKLSAALARRPHEILYNSRVGAEQHEHLGYPRSARRLIPNGFDTERLAPDPARRLQTRREFGFDDRHIVVGMVARVHPMKNYPGFVEVARRIAGRFADVRFLIAGLGTDGAELSAQIETAGIADRTVALGDRADVPDLMRSLDLAMSISVHGEGFPNVIGEAMSTAVPCVVTDVGDAAWVVGDTGTVVSINDIDGFEAALGSLIDLSVEARRALGHRARQRIREHFSLDRILDEYESLYVALHARAR